MIAPTLLTFAFLEGHQLIEQAYDCLLPSRFKRIGANLTTLARRTQFWLGRNNFIGVFNMGKKFPFYLGHI